MHSEVQLWAGSGRSQEGFLGVDQEGRKNELAFVPGSGAGEGGPEQLDDPGVGVRDKTCHPPPENLVL